MKEINETTVKSLVELIGHGLVCGVGVAEPGKMCVEAAVCYALGLPHGDEPICVSTALRKFKIVLNDANWSSNEARGKGLLRLAVAQLGTKDTLDEVKFVTELAKIADKYAKIAAKYAEHAAKYAEYAAKYAEHAAEYAAEYAVKYAEHAAEYAEHAAEYAGAGDKVLADFAEDVVQLLIEMKAEGTKWLYLTE